jgi:uncharacterized protein YjiK
MSKETSGRNLPRLLAEAFLAGAAAYILLGFCFPTPRIDDVNHGSVSKFCLTNEYRKHVLKLVQEAPFAGLFADLKNQTKFEASGVAYDPTTDSYLAVFDSSMSVARFDEALRVRGPNNVLIGEREMESQFEGISPYDIQRNQWLLLAEAVPGDGDAEWYPEVTLAQFHAGKDSYDVVERCRVDFQLTHENKGFESIIYLPEKELLLALCEGNWCEGGKRGRDRGHGKIVVSKLTRDAGECSWDVVDMLDVPQMADFQDYSAMAIREGKMAILSQEDAALALVDFDTETLSFGEEATGVVMHLPRDVHCNIVFCNAEGIAFIDGYRFMIVSDKAKSKQDVACLPHDQGAALFAVPSGII